jgi:predicted DNA-binding transcriptional regulator AlpA
MHPAESSQKRMLPAREAADLSGLSKSTLDKMRVFGGGPPYLKIGRRVVYDPADLDQWLVSHRRKSTSERDSS